MNTPLPDAQQADRPAEYTLEVLASITGVSTKTILLYQEHGIIRAAPNGDQGFDDEAARALRRIEHLRDACELNLAGLKLLAALLGEVEQLRDELRARR